MKKENDEIFSIEVVLSKIATLMSNENITANALTNKAGLTGSAITEWTKGKAKPSMVALIKIANYFNVSVDYLLGRTDDPTIHYLNEKQFKLVARGGKNIDTTNKNTPTGKTPRTTKNS